MYSTDSECYANITDSVITTIMPRTISDEGDNLGALAALGSFVTVLSIVIIVLILRLVYFRYWKKKQDTPKDNRESNHLMLPASSHRLSTETNTSNDNSGSHQPMLPPSNYGFSTQTNTPNDNREFNQPMLPASNHRLSTETNTSNDNSGSHQPMLPPSNHGFSTQTNTPNDNRESNQPMLPASNHRLSTETKCTNHDKYVCREYCKDCSISICAKCVTVDHRRHNFISLEDFLEERKVEFSNEIQEIESTTLSEYQKQKSNLSIDEKKYENTIEAIFAHEDGVCTAVREAGSKLRVQLAQIRIENLEISNKNAMEEKEIVNIIKETRALLTKNDPKDILEFKGVKCQVNSSPVLVNKRLPVFQTKHLEEGDVQSMFGALVDDEEKNEVIGGENLKKQAWFHGYIPREEAEQLMKRNGDFLVREIMNNTEQDRYVISSFRNGPVHFTVSETDVTRVGLRATLIDLVNHLVTSGEPLSNSNPTILKFPVDRNQHQLDFDQIKLGPKTDEMQRGQGLYNGTFANKAVLVSSDEDKETQLFKNVNLLRIFDHPNIVRLEGYSALWKPVLLLMENMSGGPLLTYLRGNGTSLTTKKRTEMCRDVAKGMAYLHKDKFIHRDVAARNCLVSDGGVVKIYDFWMTEKGEAYQIQDKIGRQIPIKWTAPEALLSGSYTLSSDVWSFGILMWETFSSGLLPYPGLSNKETTEQVPKGYRMKSPDDTPKSCYSLMLKCWEENPTKRGNFEEIVKKLQTIVQKTK